MINLSDYSSDFYSSEEDDKNQAGFFVRDRRFYNLPRNVRDAIENGKQKAKHSDFYYRLKNLNEKISIYKKIFYGKVPQYQKTYMLKKIGEKQIKQKKDREIFEKEVVSMKLNKIKLNRFQS